MICAEKNQKIPKSTYRPVMFKIAIDGPAASGKSTVAKWVAHKLGFGYVDSGAMYRGVALEALRRDLLDGGRLDATGAVRIAEQARFRYVLNHPPTGDPKEAPSVQVWMNDCDVTEAIRAPDVASRVGEIAALPALRAVLLQQQRALANDPALTGVVMDGRDVGSRVLPEAQLKIYMDADAMTRALRRLREEQERDPQTTVDKVHRSLLARDKADKERSVSPLVVAPDAVVLQTDTLSVAQVVDQITELARQRMQRSK
jgi:cytidylate kinase